MKKIKIMLAVMLCLVMLCACGGNTTTPTDEEIKIENEVKNETINTEDEKAENIEQSERLEIPDSNPLELVFSSGAGGWSSVITLNADGNFSGKYYDSNMGEYSADYDATVYVCEFNGKFDNIKKVDDYSYSMTLAEITTKEEPGKEWIEDRVKYVSAGPYGLEGKEYIFYNGNTPVEGLSEEFLSWWPYRFAHGDEIPTILTSYGLFNIEMGYGFFSQEN